MKNRYAVMLFLLISGTANAKEVGFAYCQKFRKVVNPEIVEMRIIPYPDKPELAVKLENVEITDRLRESLIAMGVPLVATDRHFSIDVYGIGSPVVDRGGLASGEGNNGDFFIELVRENGPLQISLHTNHVTLHSFARLTRHPRSEAVISSIEFRLRISDQRSGQALFIEKFEVTNCSLSPDLERHPDIARKVGL